VIHKVLDVNDLLSDNKSPWIIWSVKKMGRPPKPPEERMIQRSVRLPPELWEKIDRNGLDWLRALVKRAKEPPKQP
jgi:hypothetical protein